MAYRSLGHLIFVLNEALADQPPQLRPRKTDSLQLLDFDSKIPSRPSRGLSKVGSLHKHLGCGTELRWPNGLALHAIHLGAK